MKPSAPRSSRLLSLGRGSKTKAETGKSPFHPPSCADHQIEGLGKSFRIADRQPGLSGTLRHLLLPNSGRAEVAGHLPHWRQSEFLQRITLVTMEKQVALLADLLQHPACAPSWPDTTAAPTPPCCSFTRAASSTTASCDNSPNGYPLRRQVRLERRDSLPAAALSPLAV